MASSFKPRSQKEIDERKKAREQRAAEKRAATAPHLRPHVKQDAPDPEKPRRSRSTTAPSTPPSPSSSLAATLAHPLIQSTTRRASELPAPQPKAGALDSPTLRKWYQQHLTCAGGPAPDHPVPCRRPVAPPHHHHTTGSHGGRRQDVLNLVPYCFISHRHAHEGRWTEAEMALAVVNAFDTFTRRADPETKAQVLRELLGGVAGAKVDG